MKIIATVTNCAEAVHVGGGIRRRSTIIDLGNDLPPLLQKYLENRSWAKEGPNRYTYETLSFSILDEEAK
jgi:hypothetical protein